MTLIRVLLPFACGYFLSYLLRVVNAVVAPDLVRDFGLGAADLGLMTSAYFLAFAAFQLPLGILLDRFGPRRTEATLLVFAAAGCFVFAGAQGTAALIVGRALIGLGVSACLMAAFKAFVQWFPGDRLAVVNGLQLAAGGLGALAGTAPVEAALGVVDWRTLFVGLGILALAIAVAIVGVVPERPGGQTEGSFREQIGGVARVFTSPFFWRLVPLTVLSQATFLSLQSLWAAPWLRDVAGLERGAVAQQLLWIAASMVAGFLLWGIISERLTRRGVAPVSVAVAGMTMSIAVLSTIALGWLDAAAPLWIAFGFVGTTGLLIYPVLTRAFPAELAGRVITGLNLMTFAAAFAAQWGVGAVIELWPEIPDGGYAPGAYRAAFTILVVLQCVALAWYAVAPRRPVTG